MNAVLSLTPSFHDSANASQYSKLSPCFPLRYNRALAEIVIVEESHSIEIEIQRAFTLARPARRAVPAAPVEERIALCGRSARRSPAPGDIE